MSKGISHLIENRINSEFDQLRDESETVMTDSFSVDQIRDNIVNRISPRVQNRASSLVDMLLNQLTKQSEDLLDEANVQTETKNAFYRLNLREELSGHIEMKSIKLNRDPRHKIGFIVAGVIVFIGLLFIINQINVDTTIVKTVSQNSDSSVIKIDETDKSIETNSGKDNYTENRNYLSIVMGMVVLFSASSVYFVIVKLNIGWVAKYSRNSIRKTVQNYLLYSKKVTHEKLLSIENEYNEKFSQFLSSHSIDTQNLIRNGCATGYN